LNVLRVQYCYDIDKYEHNRVRFTTSRSAKDFKEFRTIYPNCKDAAKKD